MHENTLHEKSCFLTLTYNKEKLPHDNNLNPEHLRNFWRRIRKELGPLRYFACGEYGDRNNRPHYHAILFGHDFKSDRTIWSNSGEFPVYRSKILEAHGMWDYGLAGIGDVSFESAAYVARYIMKKQLGKPELANCVIDYKTGEILYERIPEFVRMSRKPGIGKEFYDKYKYDIYPHDYVLIGKRKLRPGRYYDSLMEKDDPELFKNIKEKRQEVAKSIQTHPGRLLSREKINKAKSNLLLRSFE